MSEKAPSLTLPLRVWRFIEEDFATEFPQPENRALGRGRQAFWDTTPGDDKIRELIEVLESASDFQPETSEERQLISACKAQAERIRNLFKI